MLGGAWCGMAGTSASAPVAGGLISNINAARIAIGKGSLGWMNPTLYAKAHLFTNDVLKGNNRCPGGDTCCPQGYYATKGWDPTTGFGSVNYAKMQAVFVALGAVNSGSFTPTTAPTTSVPTNLPTRIPSARPTPLPSVSPTKAKTFKPTRKPSNRPPQRRHRILTEEEIKKTK